MQNLAAKKDTYFEGSLTEKTNKYFQKISGKTLLIFHTIQPP